MKTQQILCKHQSAALLAANAELARVREERDKYMNTLIARHGGEPLALLQELDEARELADDLAKALEEGGSLTAFLLQAFTPSMHRADRDRCRLFLRQQQSALARHRGARGTV